ncbi:ATP-binding protein, partial [Candidatus Auribacterota bacterium]
TKLVIVNTLVLLIISIFIFFFITARAEQRALLNKSNKAQIMATMLSHTTATKLELFFLGLSQIDEINEKLRGVEKDKEFSFVKILDMDNTVITIIKKSLVDPRTISVTVPVYSDAQEDIGKIQVELHLKYVYSDLEKEKNVIILIILASLFCGFISIVGISHLLIRPLKRLEEVTNTFSLGRWSARVPIQHQDEIGRLGETFNRMADKIEDYTKNLEKMVIEKTAGLQKAQEQLVKLAREMGMAELAISVLHNIGNAVTPLIIKVTSLLEQVQRVDFLLLNQFNSLIETQKQYQAKEKNLVKFYTQDAKGKKMPQFIELFATFLNKQKKALVVEMEKLYTYTQHIESIIRLQMNYAKITDETHEIRLNYFVEDAIMMQQSSFDKRKINVIKHYHPNLIIYANKTKFMQILQNLLKNAYEAIDLADNNAEDVIKISTEFLKEKKMARFVIEDKGMGIAPEQATKIFEYGYTTKEHGTGFGLHSCKTFINAMKGTIRCFSEGKNKGSRFEIDLPAKIDKG